MFEAPAMNLVGIRKCKLAMKRYKSDQYGFSPQRARMNENVQALRRAAPQSKRVWGKGVWDAFRAPSMNEVQIRRDTWETGYST